MIHSVIFYRMLQDHKSIFLLNVKYTLLICIRSHLKADVEGLFWGNFCDKKIVVDSLFFMHSFLQR